VSRSIERNAPALFRSYRSPAEVSDSLSHTTIWQACRATSAAPTYFDAISIELGTGKETFVDGGLGANNPIDQLWGEAVAMFGEEKLKDNLECLVSLGTGIPSAEPFHNTVHGLFSTLKAMATDTQELEQSFRKSHPGLATDGKYFRLDVGRGLASIGLESAEEIDKVAALTRAYLNDPAVRSSVVECAARLSDVPRKLETMLKPESLE
jgi:hypothetical protein